MELDYVNRAESIKSFLLSRVKKGQRQQHEIGILLQWAPSIHSFSSSSSSSLLLIFRWFCVCPVARLPVTTIQHSQHTKICEHSQQQYVHVHTPQKIYVYAYQIYMAHTYSKIQLYFLFCHFRFFLPSNKMVFAYHKLCQENESIQWPLREFT